MSDTGKTSDTGKAIVAVIFGGVSPEREISCLTAGGVVRAIDRDRFDVVCIGVDHTGCWRRVSDDVVQAMRTIDGVLPSLPDGLAEAVLLRGGRGGQVATRVGDRLEDICDIDVAFSLLHGPYGEDGTIQGLFEMLDIRYVGVGVAASAISMDKDLTKHILATAGLPVVPWVAFTHSEWEQDQALCEESVAALGYPVFVKPARCGSSVGISRVNKPGGLATAVAEAQRWDPKVVVEKGIFGYREIEYAVLGGKDGIPRVSKPGEIIVADKEAFYDFDAKYLPAGQVALVAPTKLPEQWEAEGAEISRRVFQAVGAEGLSRVDLFVGSDGRIVVNELNTMPGFTDLSMFPTLWAETGIAYADLITDLIDQALARPLGLR